MIKAIPTKYGGCHFRSRLEARWAVFFDRLDIAWEYEKEGYELGDMGRYLPDFWFPKQKAWGEVKPDYLSIEDRISSGLKAGALSSATDRAFIFLEGLPKNKPYQMCYLDEDGNVHSEYICFHIHSSGNFYILSTGNPECVAWDDVERAACAAKSARFEYGESG